MVDFRGTHILSCSGTRWPCPPVTVLRAPGDPLDKSHLERKPLEKAKLVESFYILLSSREIRFVLGGWKLRFLQSSRASEMRSKVSHKLP